LYKTYSPSAFFMDKIGIGSGICDRLIELGIPVIGVNSAERAFKEDKYVNRRAEMWGDMREWLLDQPASIPNDPVLISDLSSPRFTIDSASRVKLEPKAKMKARGIASPDRGDALALTFAMPVFGEQKLDYPPLDWVI
jgi:hypothetical protein